MTSGAAPYIQVKDLTAKTPLGPVYENVSFSVEKGQVIALFGSEGSGKTSMLLTVAGRMKFTSGEASVAGFNLQKSYKKVRRISNVTIIERVNDVPTNSRVRDIVSAELQVVGKPSGRSAVDAFFKAWDMEHLANKRFRDLESFDAKHFDIALACAGNPELLLVDDIQEGLTQHQSIRIVKALKEYAKAKDLTVIIGVLEYDIARYADAMVVFSRSAERQRQVINRERGEVTQCPVCGTGNGVVLDGDNTDVMDGGAR